MSQGLTYKWLKKKQAIHEVNSLNKKTNKNKIKKGLQDLPLTKSAVKAYVSNPIEQTDPFGCYTGVPIDENDTPTQDADDL